MLASKDQKIAELHHEVEQVTKEKDAVCSERSKLALALEACESRKASVEDALLLVNTELSAVKVQNGELESSTLLLAKEVANKVHEVAEVKEQSVWAASRARTALRIEQDKKRFTQIQLSRTRRLLFASRAESASLKSENAALVASREGLRSQVDTTREQVEILAQENIKLVTLLADERDSHTFTRAQLQECRSQAVATAAKTEDLEDRLKATLERAHAVEQRTGVLCAHNMLTRSELGERTKALHALKVHFRAMQVANGFLENGPLMLNAESGGSTL